MRKLRGIAMFLLLVFTLNFIPVQAISNSKFGITDVWGEKLENGERNIFLAINEENAKDIKEIKLYTNVVSEISTSENYTSVVVDGPTVILNREDRNLFKGILNESQIKDFGNYKVNRIEMFLEDGTRRVSYNSKYYTSISDNNKENGELVEYLGDILYEEPPLEFEKGSFEFNTVKLGQDQNFIFNIAGEKNGIEAKKVYVKFTKYDDSSNREIVSIAEKLEDGSYSAKLNLKNSLDTGNWNISNITVVDNYDRQYNLKYVTWNGFKVVSENTDIEAPKLNSIELSSNVYDGEDGTPITLTLDISDDISGFYQGYISLKNGESTTSIAFENYDIKDGKVEIQYSNFERNGIWEISSIYLRDNAKNYVTYVQVLEDYMGNDSHYVQRDFSAQKIEVINIKEKPEANIEILEIINNKPEVTNGKEIDLTIKVKSDINLSSIIDMNYSGKSTYKYLYLYGYLESEYDENGYLIENKDGIYTYNVKGYDEKLKYLATNIYECNYFSVGYYDDNGRYYYQSVINSNSEDYLWGNNPIILDLSDLNINCNNPDEDITPPEIVDISIDKPVITLGESIELKIKVNDNKSGTNRMGMDLNYSLLNSDNIIITYDEESLTYTAKVTIPEYATTGKYTVSYANVNDIADNYRHYNWYNDSDKELLSKATILVKSDLNEKLPPEITTNIKANGEVFKAPFTPIVSTDHGTISMLLDGEKYDGEAIKKVGNHQLYIEATGVDGSVSTKLVSFKIIAEINNETKPEDIVDQIISSTDKEVIVEVSSDSKEIDKSIFEAIKGEDKTVSFKQEDGTVWSFNGKDITDENLEGIENIKISVSSEPEEENKDFIESLDSEARVIHFDYHGVLPGKATVKIKVDNPGDLMGKELTFYYFNPETQKAEKVQGPLSIDNEGYVTVEIEHCSDYFLSADDSLHLDEPIITVEKEEIELVEGETKNIGAIVEPENTKLEYTSSNENVVTVDTNGLLTAKSEGEAKITIKALEVTKEITVKVKKKENDSKPEVKPQDPVITVEKEEIELVEGETKKINAIVKPENTKLEYTSSNENVVTVDEDGLLTAKSEGEAKITIKALEVIKEVTVKVKKKDNDSKPEVKPQEPVEPSVPEEEEKPQEPVEPTVPEEEVKPETPVKPIIIIERDQIELNLGEFFNINAKVIPVDKTLEYISTNTNIVEVNKFGLITTKMPGEAIIVVKCEDVIREIKVTVKKNEEVTIEGDKIDTNTDVIEDNNSNNKNEENQNKLPTTGQVVSSLQLGLAALMVIGVGTILFRKRKNIN